MFGGGGSTVTQSGTSSSTPWSAAQPALKKALGEATRLYDEGSGFTPYEGSLVIPYADETLQGMSGIKNYADAYSDNMQRPMEQQMDIMYSGGYNPYQQNAMDRTAQLAGGTGYNQELTNAAQSLGNLNNQMRDNGGLTSYQQKALEQNQALAGGSEIFGQNPGFQRVLENAQKAMTDSSNTAAAKMGRYGSGAHQGTLADSIGDVTGKMYSDEYGRQLSRMDQARQNMFGQSQQGLGNIDSAAKGLASIGQTGYENITQANNDLFGGGQMGLDNMQNAAGNMAAAYNLGQQPYRDYMGIGGMNEDLATRTMQDELRKHQGAENSDWERVAALNAIAGGAGRLGGTTTEATYQPTKSPFGSALGSAAANFNKTNDWASAAGSGIASLLGSWF